MAKKKVTLTLRDDQIDAIRALVEAGKASSVSGFVQHAVDVSLADVAGWSEMLNAALAATGGPLTREERTWADSVLKPGGSSKRGRDAARAGLCSTRAG